MKDKRPVNLELTTMKFPVAAITSILHRVTGVLLFLALPFLLWFLQMSLSGEGSYYALAGLLSGTFMRCIVWVFIAVMGYHILAGVKHLLVDLNILSVSERAGSCSSWTVIALTIILVILTGVWIW